MPQSIHEKRYGQQFRPLFSDGSDYSMPSINIKETENGFSIELAIPGVKKEHLKINLERDLLTVSTDEKARTETDTVNYKRKEFGFSQFSRTFRIPEKVNPEEIKARHENGILTIQLPKVKEEKINKAIKVN